MFKFYTDNLKANLISVLLCIGLGPIYTMIINTNEDIFTKCMVGNVISGSIYIFMFGCFFWAMVDCCHNFCGVFKKQFTNVSMLSWINPIFALISVCCGALFTAAVYRDADCATKCMFGNVLSVVSLLLILFIISCGKCCCGYSAVRPHNEEGAAHV